MDRAPPASLTDLLGQAAQLHAAGRLAEALAVYDRITALHPGSADAHDFKSAVLVQLGRLQEALDSLDQVVALTPGNPNAFGNRGNVLVRLGRPQEALASFDRALALAPNLAAARLNRGDVLVALERLEDAADSYRRALALTPAHAGAAFRLGEVLARLGRMGEAEACYRRTAELAPRHAEAQISWGLALLALRRFEEALGCFERATGLDPQNARAWNNAGVALTHLRRRREALARYERATTLDPDPAAFHQNQAGALQDLDRLEEALAAYDRALARDPNLRHGQGAALFTAMSLCAWDGLDERAAAVLGRIGAVPPATTPFPLLAVTDDAELQKRCAQAHCTDAYPPRLAPPAAGKPPRRDRIRIGYFSADFHGHATMHLFAETLEAHDRTRFEVTAFSFGFKTDEWRERATGAVGRFLDVSALSDAEAAEQARRMQIDIAIDLNGYGVGRRTGVFAERAAPIQTGYLAYPGTMGAPFIDYLIADRVVIPEALKPAYSEKIVFLPGCYQPNRRVAQVSDAVVTRRQAGLPEAGFVYCCFNQAYKITPQVFDRWMTILRLTDRSVLWLWANRPTVRDNLRREAVARGVDPGRLVFAATLPPDQHLGRLPLADLFLDTFPCAAHTTASDALRMGLPLLTCAGQTFASRVAASLLTAVGLTELVTDDLQDYEALAVALAADRERMASIRRRLAQTVKTNALFDGAGFARKLEAAYAAMYERLRNGLPPEDIYL